MININIYKAVDHEFADQLTAAIRKRAVSTKEAYGMMLTRALKHRQAGETEAAAFVKAYAGEQVPFGRFIPPRIPNGGALLTAFNRMAQAANG